MVREPVAYGRLPNPASQPRWSSHRAVRSRGRGHAVFQVPTRTRRDRSVIGSFSPRVERREASGALMPRSNRTHPALHGRQQYSYPATPDAWPGRDLPGVSAQVRSPLTHEIDWADQGWEKSSYGRHRSPWDGPHRCYCLANPRMKWDISVATSGRFTVAPNMPAESNCPTTAYTPQPQCGRA